MFTIISDSAQILPSQVKMPTLKDDLGGGAVSLRRQHTRSLRRWEIALPDRQREIDPVLGLFEFVQGDTDIWFDGAGTIEVVEPILLGIGDGVIRDFPFSHRHVFVSSAVIYLNGAPTSAWVPLGDGVTMAALRFDAAPAVNFQVTAKYRRKAKVVLETEELAHESQFTDPDNSENNFYTLRYFLQEVPF